MLTGQTVSETIWILKLVMIAREATVTVLVYIWLDPVMYQRNNNNN